ncbi:MAG: universal stress protein [Anaerolineae bacterium]|nr:universal stress protein [Anaerolineae bacterium]
MNVMLPQVLMTETMQNMTMTPNATDTDSRCKRIAVILDGTGAAERALPQAIEMAQESDAQLILIGVFKPDGVTHITGMNDVIFISRSNLWYPTRDEVHDYILSLVNKLRRQNLDVRGHWVEGDEWTAACPTILAEEADLVVMVEQPRPWLANALLGEASVNIHRRTQVPVITVYP